MHTLRLSMEEQLASQFVYHRACIFQSTARIYTHHASEIHHSVDQFIYFPPKEMLGKCLESTTDQSIFLFFFLKSKKWTTTNKQNKLKSIIFSFYIYFVLLQKDQKKEKRLQRQGPNPNVTTSSTHSPQHYNSKYNLEPTTISTNHTLRSKYLLMKGRINTQTIFSKTKQNKTHSHTHKCLPLMILTYENWIE